MPKYATLAAKVNELVAGASLPNIATALGETYNSVRNALAYARRKEKPKTKPVGKCTGTRTGSPKYEALAPEVTRLRDMLFPFTDIAKQLKISEPTARAAYDHAHREDIGKAVREGQPVQRGRHRRIGHDMLCDVRERLDRGESIQFIADATGCSATTVRRICRDE